MPLTLDGTAGMTAPVGAVYNGLQRGTAVASTSGTSIDFTGIPLWVERITVMFNGVSTSGTSNIQAQIGSGSVTTSGYLSQANTFNTTPTGTASTAAFLLLNSVAAAAAYNGKFEIVNINGNNWVMSGVLAATAAANGVSIFGGSVTLAGSLDRVRITTAGGTDTFDAGTINIFYE
jgi:hypothetical protein